MHRATIVSPPPPPPARLQEVPALFILSTRNVSCICLYADQSIEMHFATDEGERNCAIGCGGEESCNCFTDEGERNCAEELRVV